MNTNFSVNTVILELNFRGIRWGLLLGLVCGILAGFPIFGIGALFGMFIGPIIGTICGALSGFLLSLITLLLYKQIPQVKRKRVQYRIVAALVCTLASLAVTYSFITQHWPISDIADYFLPFVIVPTILAALRSSQGLATWYIGYREDQ